jgi:DNA-binding FrmR family transcriptional regulator
MKKLDLSTEEISAIFRFKEKIVDKNTTYRYILNQSLLLRRGKMTEEKKKVLNRLRRTEGQIRGIQKMIDEEKECIDVITQLSAVRSSIDRVMGMIVAENLKHCFENPEKDPKEQEERLAQAINMIVKK